MSYFHTHLHLILIRAAVCILSQHTFMLCGRTLLLLLQEERWKTIVSAGCQMCLFENLTYILTGTGKEKKNIPRVQIPNPKLYLPFSCIITKTHTKVNDSDVLFIFYYFVTIKKSIPEKYYRISLPSFRNVQHASVLMVDIFIL